MDTFDAIRWRRSIRKFTKEPVARKDITRILEAGILAPSAKNRQPWRFIVIAEEREAMAEVLRTGLAARVAAATGDEERTFLDWSRRSYEIMESAPVNIFILNTHGKPPEDSLAPYGERFIEMANVQSIGAAIQNMCLAATALGLGSLWVADVYDVFPALATFLGTNETLVAALSIGHPDETPNARPRSALESVATWR